MQLGVLNFDDLHDVKTQQQVDFRVPQPVVLCARLPRLRLAWHLIVQVDLYCFLLILQWQIKVWKSKGGGKDSYNPAFALNDVGTCSAVGLEKQAIRLPTERPFPT